MAIRANPLPGAFLFFWLFLTFGVSRPRNARARAARRGKTSKQKLPKNDLILGPNQGKRGVGFNGSKNVVGLILLR